MALSELDIATKWNNEIKFYKFIETLFYGYLGRLYNDNRYSGISLKGLSKLRTQKYLRYILAF